MALPLTLATFRGVLVTAAEHTFVIPTANMERTIRVRREEIGTVENRDTISLEGVAVPLVKLADMLELPGKSEEPAVITVLVLASQGKRAGFSVDEILNEQEVLIKNLAPPLSRVRNIAAAAILGSGRGRAGSQHLRPDEIGRKSRGPSCKAQGDGGQGRGDKKIHPCG